MTWLRADATELQPSDGPSRSSRRVAGIDAGQAGRRAAEIARFHELLAVAGEAFADRRTAPAHLTASAVVVDASCERAVVLHHAKLGRWLQPGGHADGDHELAGVALREAAEETGIDGLAVWVPAVDLDLHEVDHGDVLGVHVHVDLRFVVAAPQGAVLRGNHESTALRWATPAEVRELSGDEDLVHLIELGLRVAASSPPPGAL